MARPVCPPLLYVNNSSSEVWIRAVWWRRSADGTGAGSHTRLLQPFSHFLLHHCQHENLSERTSCTPTALSLSVHLMRGFTLSFPLNRCSSHFPPNNKIHFAFLIQTVVNEVYKGFMTSSMWTQF